MADVRIVDIDGSQWAMKDQEARNKIAELETKTTIKKTVLYNTNKLNITVLEINEEKFLQAHFDGIGWNGIIGGELMVLPGSIGNTTVLRGIVHISPTSQGGRMLANIDFGTEGQINVYPILQDKSTGTLSPASIYGDIFLKII